MNHGSAPGERVRAAWVCLLAVLFALLAPAGGRFGSAGTARAQDRAVVPAATAASPEGTAGWKVGVVNTADARGEILPCT